MIRSFCWVISVPNLKKKQKVTFFAIAATFFRVNETVDDKVDDELVTTVNSLFWEEIVNDRLEMLTKTSEF